MATKPKSTTKAAPAKKHYGMEEPDMGSAKVEKRGKSDSKPKAGKTMSSKITK